MSKFPHRNNQNKGNMNPNSSYIDLRSKKDKQRYAELYGNGQQRWEREVLTFNFVKCKCEVCKNTFDKQTLQAYDNERPHEFAFVCNNCNNGSDAHRRRNEVTQKQIANLFIQ